MAADFQNKYPNPCKLSPEGHFGSKFVTVVVTGKMARIYSKSCLGLEGKGGEWRLSELGHCII